MRDFDQMGKIEGLLITIHDQTPDVPFCGRCWCLESGTSLLYSQPESRSCQEACRLIFAENASHRKVTLSTNYAGWCNRALTLRLRKIHPGLPINNILVDRHRVQHLLLPDG